MLKKSELEIKGHSLYINNFEEKGVRGVAIYVKKNIATVQIYPRESAPDTAWVEIKASKNKKMIIGGIYRSPNNSCDNNEKLWKTITYMASLYKDNMLLMGDFNCSGIVWTNQLTVDQDTNSLNNKLIETLRDCYLEQVITENTRARGSNIPSLLDLVLCYDREQISNIAYLGPLGKSDHCVVTLLYNITFESCSYKVKRNIYDKVDYTAIKKHLSNIGWNIILSEKSVQQQWDVLVDNIGSFEDQYNLSKMVEINRDDKFGEKLPNHIRLQIKKKHNMWKRYMETRSPDIYRTFCRSRNKVKNLIKKFRKQKETDIRSNIKRNPKAFWSYTNSKTTVKNTIASLHSDPKDQTSNLIDNSREKANILNSYFASVYTKEPPDEIPKLAHRKGSVLGPLLFLIYINDLPDDLNSDVYMYADDTKLYREIKTIEDQRILQKDLDTLTKWSEIWLLKFHPEKCINLTIGIGEPEESSYHMMIDNVKHKMTKIEEIKDIGVIIDSNLTFEKHIKARM